MVGESGASGTNTGSGGATAGASGSSNGGTGGASAGAGGDAGAGAGGDAGAGEPATLTIIEPFPPGARPPGVEETVVPELSIGIWGISDDGSVFVGQSGTVWSGVEPIYIDEPVVWTRATGLVHMGTFEGILAADMQPRVVSADGSAAYGWYFRRPDPSSSFSERTFAGFFRWTASTGLTSFGHGEPYELGWLGHTSRDGRTALGRFFTADGRAVPFLWTEQQGLVYLADTPGWPANGEVQAMSDDASVLLVSSDENSTLMRWHDGVLEDLGKLPGASYCVGSLMTPDGAVILGQCTDDEGDPGARVFRWTEPDDWFEYDFTANDGFIVSGDGTVALRFDGTTLERWTPNGRTTERLPRVGSVGTTYHLMDLNRDASFGYGYLLAQNTPDGTYRGNSGTEAFRFDETSGIKRLGFLPGHDGSDLNAASRDGRFLTGSSWAPSEPYEPIQAEAVLWDASGPRDIRAAVEAGGIDVTDVTLSPGTHVWSGPPILVFGNGTKRGTGILWFATLPER
jgi:hypothetical protein